MTFRAKEKFSQGKSVSRQKSIEQGENLNEYLVAATLAFLFLVIVTTFVGRLYVVPSGSMEPTLHGCTGCNNDRILVEKLSYVFHDPVPGDVIVFEGTDSWNAGFEVQRSSNVLIRGGQNFLAAVGLIPNDENILTKRVIAVAGQTVSCQAGDAGVMVDGQIVDQSHVLSPAEFEVTSGSGSQACGGAYFGPVQVPEGSLWVMGDNRTNSADSRAHIGDKMQGTIPVENVRGKVRLILLPISRFGGVN